MTNEQLEKLTKLKGEIKRIEGVLEMFDSTENRYRLRKLFFPKTKRALVKWGHAYGLDNVQFDLEYEDTLVIVEHFKKKLERLKLGFEGE